MKYYFANDTKHKLAAGYGIYIAPGLKDWVICNETAVAALPPETHRISVDEVVEILEFTKKKLSLWEKIKLIVKALFG